MKYLYLLITLLILVACGPKNLFDGSYEGEVAGDVVTAKIEGDNMILTVDGVDSIDCSLEDPTTASTAFSCDIGLNGPASIDGDTLTLAPEGEQVGVFKRVE
tara:strand:+ start:551 stop:856 length:306 start_codon:yes stop_codon:yes gene_type:complete